MSGIITLLTDFGHKDHYVGVMKGVILSINPAVNVVDISHHVSPHNVLEGALMLLHSYAFFPAGTIHLAVVDPGVGTERNALLVTSGDYYFIGPDNGVFGLVYGALKEYRVFALTNSRFRLSSPGNTFHGRDIFAPVGAYLSTGVSPAEMGHEVTEYTRLSLPAPVIKEGRVKGTIIYIDGFGNLITTISRHHIENINKTHRVRIKIGGRTIPQLSETYQSVTKGEVLALIGSSELLEISVREGNAHTTLNVNHGDEVEIIGE
jgi:hypothetical protein